MCVMSMVHDYLGRYPWPDVPSMPKPVYVPVASYPPVPTLDWSAIKIAIEDFHKSVAAAKIVDDLTGQPDCEDPDKLRLAEKIVALEKRIAELEAK